MSKVLKLDFNERSDAISPLAENSLPAESLWQYPDRLPLETKIAELNGLNSEQVLCTNGGDEAIMLLMRLAKETAPLILPLPAFSQYTWGLQSWDLNAQQIPPKDDLSIDVEKTCQAIEQSPNGITVITRPNNPTGEFISLDSVKLLLSAASKVNGWIFLDEAYIEFSEEFYTDKGSATSLLDQYNNLVILRTLSKAYGLAGIRLGYLLGSKSIIDQFKLRCLPFNVPQPSLAIAMKALAADNQAEVAAYCQQIINNRSELSDWLTSLGIEVLKSQANFVTIRLPKNQAIAVKSYLSKNQILVRGFTDALMQDCLRITIPANLDKLRDLLQIGLKPGLICLDMDEVLIDTSQSYASAIIQTVQELGSVSVTRNDIERLKNSGGFNNDWVVTQALLKEADIEIELDRVIEVFQRIYLGKDGNGLIANETRLINTQMVNRLNQLTNTQVAIVTGRPRFEAEQGVKLLQLKKPAIVSLDDVSQGKPSPEGIKKLQQEFSTLSWMCGDNPDDMLAASRSNSLAIGIASENSEVLYQAGADIVLNSINDLEDWLCPIQ